MTDRSMESIRLSNSGVHQRVDSEEESKRVSRSKTELREGSLQALSHGLQTNIGPVHRCSKVNRERMLRRHSWVNSAQSEMSTDSASVSPVPSLHSMLENDPFGLSNTYWF